MLFQYIQYIYKYEYYYHFVVGIRNNAFDNNIKYVLLMFLRYFLFYRNAILCIFIFQSKL